MNMKIYSRYLSPKSPLSERGLTIAPLQFLTLLDFLDLSHQPMAYMHMKICPRYKYSKIATPAFMCREKDYFILMQHFVPLCSLICETIRELYDR